MNHPAIPSSMADRLADLGDIPLSRVCSDPPPGNATIEDLIRLNESGDKLYELIDHTLVEKAVDWQESMLAAVLAQWLGNYLDSNNIGVATGADGMSRLFGDTVRGPGVAFVSWSRLPGGRIPIDPVPELVPNFVIEVLSISNTRGEMARKRREYFQAGVRLIWMVDPRGRTVAVFHSPDDAKVIGEEGSLDGGDVLPGWEVNLAELFSRLDREKPPKS